MYQNSNAMATTKATPRLLSVIAKEIYQNWNRTNSGTELNYAAKDYLIAMFTLNSINDRYLFESGREVVARFLCNANSWKGETARRIKKELNAMLRSK